MKDYIFIYMYKSNKQLLFTSASNTIPVENKDFEFFDVVSDKISCDLLIAGFQNGSIAFDEMINGGHFNKRNAIGFMATCLVYDNEEKSLKTITKDEWINKYSIMGDDSRYSLVSFFDSEERANVVGNIIIETSLKTGNSIKHCYMKMISGGMHDEYSRMSVEYTSQLIEESREKMEFIEINVLCPEIGFTMNVQCLAGPINTAGEIVSNEKDMQYYIMAHRASESDIEFIASNGNFITIPASILKNSATLVKFYTK